MFQNFTTVCLGQLYVLLISITITRGESISDREINIICKLVNQDVLVIIGYVG